MRKALLALLCLLLLAFQVPHTQLRAATQCNLSVSVTGEGTVTPDRSTVSRGDTIFLTVTPGPGQALLKIEARLAPSVSGGLNIFVRLLPVDDTHYAIVLTGDTQLTATFVAQPVDGLGRMPYALYLSDQTLLFASMATPPAVGDAVLGSTVVALWGSIEITYSSYSSSADPGWNAVDEEDKALYPYRRVVFDESFSTARPTNLSNWFSVYFEGGPETIEGLQYLNTSETTSMSGMFWDCANLTGIDLSHFDTRQVTNMSYMFSGCTGLRTLDLFGFDMGRVVNGNRMFEGCTSLERIYCDDTWNVSRNVKMFADCPKLCGAVAWDESAVTGAMANPVSGYFTYASGDLDGDGSLTSLDVDLLARLVVKGEAPTRVSDINHDSHLTLSDVTALSNRLR